ANNAVDVRPSLSINAASSGTMYLRITDALQACRDDTGRPNVAIEAWQPTAIAGVLHWRAEAHSDNRGSFTELWRASRTAAVAGGPFVQANMSRSSAGVLRGMHFHRRQSDLWVLIEGRALAATTDLRGLLGGGFGAKPSDDVASQIVELTPGSELLIPPLVAHGFWALEDTALMYLVTNEFDGTDEHGFAWDDPRAALDWPTGEPILSERDQSNPTLAELARAAQQSSAR
ncbi:MAG: dTDP-4-dehydrorhamnose 3,5-epimerase family protein, partial [Chloroflexota bacterium]